MRDIKFRAWNREKNIMVYDNEDDTCGYWDGCYNSNIGMINTILNSKYYEQYDFMQYAGLKDKNGKEIYEGDIIQYKDITKGLIRYSEKYAQYVLVNTGTVKDEFEPLGDYNMEVFEIIGNEFDNPELLGKENKDE